MALVECCFIADIWFDNDPVMLGQAGHDNNSAWHLLGALFFVKTVRPWERNNKQEALG